MMENIKGPSSTLVITYILCLCFNPVFLGLLFDRLCKNGLTAFFAIVLAFVEAVLLFGFRPVFTKYKVWKEYEQYKSDYNRLIAEINEILSKGWTIESAGGKSSVAVAYMPDGKVRTVDFGTAAENWLLCGTGGKTTPPSVRAEDLLAGPDIAIIRCGKYKYQAAGRIRKKAEEKCRKIKDSLAGDALWLKNRSAVYVTREGRVCREVFSLPASTLFPEQAEKDTCVNSLADSLISEEELISAVRGKVS